MANQVHHTRRIPYLLMRGGTSKGGYFLKQHLPSCRQAISKLLLTVYGTIQPLHADDKKLEAQPGAAELPKGGATEMLLQSLSDDVCSKQVNGIGGGTSISSKAAILSKSSEEGIDVDYLFAQVNPNRPFVDFQPSCGNILSGVGPAAIEMGLIDKEKIGQKETTVTIRAMNNNSIVTAIVQTPGGEISYEGHTRIDGVGGPAAPVVLSFSNVVGSKSGGKLLPSGKIRDTFEGIEVTCIDVAMPMVIARAKSFGKTGHETPDELNKDEKFFEKLEAVRKLAGEAMGYGDVTGSVIPKFAIVAEKDDEEKEDGKQKRRPNITARYFVPDSTHAAMAVTGAICLSCCSVLKGSVAHDVYRDFDEKKGTVTDDLSAETKEGEKKVVAEVPPEDVSEVTDSEGRKKNVKKVVIGHPSGSIAIVLESEQKEGEMMTVKSAGVVRTARLIGSGFLRVPSHWWDFDSHDDSPDAQKLQSDIDELHKKFVGLFRLPVPESAKKTEDSAPQENGSPIQL